jgi:hypothetical protein
MRPMAVDPILRLRNTGEKLPPKLRAELVALPETIPAIIAVLGEDTGGWPSIHAANLLIDMKATAAIEPLLRALSVVELDDTLANDIVLRLSELGREVVEPALARLAGSAMVSSALRQSNSESH